MIELEHRQSIQIPDPSTVAIRCVAGCLWVTQEGDPDDHILQTGQSIRFRKPGLVIASALRPAVLQVTGLRDCGSRSRQITLALDPDGTFGSLLPAGATP